jgi:hypothetical protein
MKPIRSGKIQVIKKIIALTFPEAGRLFFMRIIQNGDNYIHNSQYNHKFFVCTHNYHPFRKTSETDGTTPPQLPG